MKIKTANLAEYQTNYYLNNKEKLKQYHKEYGQKYKAEIKLRRIKNEEKRMELKNDQG